MPVNELFLLLRNFVLSFFIFVVLVAVFYLIPVDNKLFLVFLNLFVLF
jgi:hypothetical protein